MDDEFLSPKWITCRFESHCSCKSRDFKTCKGWSHLEITYKCCGGASTCFRLVGGLFHFLQFLEMKAEGRQVEQIQFGMLSWMSKFSNINRTMEVENTEGSTLPLWVEALWVEPHYHFAFISFHCALRLRGSELRWDWGSESSDILTG